MAAAELDQCLGGGFEKKVVNLFGVGFCEGIQLVGKRENDVEIVSVKDPSLLFFQPNGLGEILALRTVPVPTGVVGGNGVTAVVAQVEVPAQRRGSAVTDIPNRLGLFGDQPMVLTV